MVADERAVLAASGLGFAYAETTILDGVTFDIAAGELCCIVGQSGAGKSTLLRIAGGLLSPGAGTVHTFGLDPATARRRQLARRLAYLPQDFSLAFPFTVTEVVLMGRYAHRGRGFLGLESAADRDAAQAAMARVDVLPLAHRRWTDISGGERRRALLAQAFCQHAELLLLDEPTAALDPAHALAVMTALSTGRDGGTAAVCVTHDLNLAARFADRVLVLAAGRQVAWGPPAEILAQPEVQHAFGVPLHMGTLPGSRLPFVVPAA